MIKKLKKNKREESLMNANKQELIEYLKHSIEINLESFKVLSRKCLEYKLERILEYKEIQLIDVGLDHLMTEKMCCKKVDEPDIVIKMSINDNEPEKPYILVECEECHEINEVSFNTTLELMVAINHFSSHRLYKILNLKE